MMKQRTFAVGLVLMGITTVFVSSASAYSTTKWVTDVATCGIATEANVSCSSGLVCGTYNTGENPYCNTASAINTAMPNPTTVTTNSLTPSGQPGFHYNCWGANDCSTGAWGNWQCEEDTVCSSKQQKTVCKAVAGSADPADCATGGTACFTGYTDCNADVNANGTGNGCEIQTGVTSYPSEPNATYNTSCAVTCKTTHLDCNANLGTAADGCEIQKDVTDSDGTGGQSRLHTHYGTTCGTFVCDAGYVLANGDTTAVEGCIIQTSVTLCTVTATSLPGVCTAAGTTGTTSGSDLCACSALPSEKFVTGGSDDGTGFQTTPATFTTANPLLWGQQLGIGKLMQFGLDANSDGDFEDIGDTISFEVGNDGSMSTSEGTFAVDATGKITAGKIGIADITGNGVTNGYVLGINGDGNPAWVDPGNLSVTGDNLGTHIATEMLKMGANKIVFGTGDTNGIAVATTTGNVTMDGSLTVATGLTVTSGNLSASGTMTASGTGASSVGGAFTAGGNLTVNGTGVSAIAGDLTVSDGDVVFGDANSAGTIKLSDGSSNMLTLQTGSLASDLSLTLPTAAGTTGQVLTTNGSGVMSWTYKTGADLTCSSGEVMKWNGSAWECADPAAISGAKTLDVAYDAINSSAGRTVQVDADAIKFSGSHATNDVFQLAQTNVSGTGDIVDIINQGTGNAIRINDGTGDIFVVDANGNITITSDTGAPLTINTNELVVDTNGNTIVKQLGLLSTVADGNGKPNFTCNASVVGYIAYALASGTGNYYGCKEVSTGVYAWVSLEVFGA